MARIIYHLGTCSTCQRILKKIPDIGKVTLREIKSEPLTGQELDACTVWQGVIYTADAAGAIGLLPRTGDAPKTLVFPDLGPSLGQSAAYRENGLSKLPWDVFALQGCQE